jgi:hypothetical protein
MSHSSSLRKKYSHLRKKPGPRAGWQARCAADLGYSPSHISRLINKASSSPAALAAIAAWKAANHVL